MFSAVSLLFPTSRKRLVERSERPSVAGMLSVLRFYTTWSGCRRQSGRILGLQQSILHSQECHCHEQTPRRHRERSAIDPATAAGARLAVEENSRTFIGCTVSVGPAHAVTECRQTHMTNGQYALETAKHTARLLLDARGHSPCSVASDFYCIENPAPTHPGSVIGTCRL